ncbi:MAG: choice-of-anchor Q domain-containing protein [Planctomycetota bacterium]
MSTPLLRLFAELRPSRLLTLSRCERRRVLRNHHRPLAAEVLETRQLPAQIVVTSLLDEVRDDGEVTLREAIQAANLDQSVDGSTAGNGTDEIAFAPALLSTGSVQINISSGELVITSPLRITGFGPASTVLSAQGLGRLFRITDGASSVELTGLGLTGGVTFLDPSAEFPNEQNGAAILHDADGTLKLVDCLLSDNQTFGIGAAGGAIYTESGCTLVRCIVQNNRTSGIDAPGGAICTFSGYLEIRETMFVGNATLGDDAPGGAVFVGTNGANISGSRFLSNSTAGANAPGGSLAIGPGLDTIVPAVSVENTDFQLNSTVGNGAFGGAISVDAGVLQLRRCQVVGNSTAGGTSPGGGIAARNASALEITNSTIAENETEGGTSPGGGLAVNNGTLLMIQSTVSGNRTLGSQSHGGGLAASLGSLQLVQSTVTGNQAGQLFSASGGGVYSTAQSTVIRNTIIAGNQDSGSAPDLSMMAADARNGGVRSSLIGRSNGNGLTTTTGTSPDNLGNFVGGNTAALALDARLNPLRANGGRTLTHAPRADSLAIDNGNPAFALDQAGQPLLTDQRSEAPLLRSRGSSVDIGAVERLQITGPIVVSTSVYEMDANVSAGDLSLPEAISLANASEGTDIITFAPQIDSVPISLVPGAGRVDADLVIRESVEIRGNGTTRTILDAGGKRRIFDITEDAADVILENMLLRNGNPDLSGLDAEDHRGAGGAVRMFGPGSLTLRTMVLTGNRTQHDNAPGGAIAFYGGTLTIVDSAIENNSTSGADSDGGGLLSSATRTLISRSTFAGNQTSGLRSDGGALSAMNGGLTLSQVTVSGNRVLGVDATGGGIYCDVVAGASTPDFGSVISQSTIVLNSTSQAAGGGLASPLSIDLRNTIMARNTASGFQFNNTLVQGTDLWQKFEAPLTVTASLIGRSNDTTLIPTGLTPNASGNLIGGLTAGTAIDPLLSPLANNGGPTRTHLPNPGSPVIERGRNPLAVDVTAPGTPPALVYDQRGIISKRQLDGDHRAAPTPAIVDMGAVEFPGVRLTSPSPSAFTLRPVLRWTALPAVTGWKIHVNSETTGQSGVITATVTTNEFTPTADLPVGSYKIWIMPQYSDTGALWNTPQIFNVLAAPVLQSMERTQYIARPQLLWNALPGAVQYDIWGNNVSTGQQQTFRLTVQGTSWTPPVDLPLGIHRFWIRGLDAKNQPTGWSVAQEFLVVTVVTPLSPGSSLFDTTPDFTWQPVAGAVSYELVLRNASTNVVVINQQNITGTRFTPTAALPIAGYKWYVLAVSPASVGSLKSGRAITRDVFVGGRTTVLAPSGTSQVSWPEFRWQLVDDATTYTLHVSRLTGSSYQKAIEVSGLTSTSWQPATALAAGSYRTWVQVVSGSNAVSLWSNPLDFSIL